MSKRKSQQFTASQERAIAAASSALPAMFKDIFDKFIAPEKKEQFRTDVA